MIGPYLRPHLLLSRRNFLPTPTGQILTYVGGLALGFLTIATPTSPAMAQLDKILPDAVQKILPGAEQGSSEALSAGKTACERYAQNRGFDVRRIREARPTGKNNIQVTLDIERRDGRQDYICTYDTGDNEVRTLEPAQPTQARDSDHGVTATVARRARQACEDVAQQRDYTDVEVTDVSPRNAMVQVEMRVRGSGSNRNLACLYDNTHDKAFLAD